VKNILLTIKDCETDTIESPIVRTTIELAGFCSSRVHIIHVVPPYKAPYNVDSETFRREVASELRHEHKLLHQLAGNMRSQNIDAKALLAQGEIITTILQETERLAIDMVILGRHKRGPLYRLLTDDTDEGMLAKCSCPILFVPVD
jgi:nucleotide-binding universal stress UspA family protein